MLFYVFSCCLVQLSLFILKFVFQHLFLVSIPWVFKIVLVMCAVCFVLSDIFQFVFLFAFCFSIRFVSSVCQCFLSTLSFVCKHIYSFFICRFYLVQFFCFIHFFVQFFAFVCGSVIFQFVFFLRYMFVYLFCCFQCICIYVYIYIYISIESNCCYFFLVFTISVRFEIWFVVCFCLFYMFPPPSSV